MDFLNCCTGNSVAITNSSASILRNCDLRFVFKYLCRVGLTKLLFPILSYDTLRRVDSSNLELFAKPDTKLLSKLTLSGMGR